MGAAMHEQQEDAERCHQPQKTATHERQEDAERCASCGERGLGWVGLDNVFSCAACWDAWRALHQPHRDYSAWIQRLGAKAVGADKSEGKKGGSFGADQPRMCWTCHFPSWWPSVGGCSRDACPDHSAEARQLWFAMDGKARGDDSLEKNPMQSDGCDADGRPCPSLFGTGDSGGGPPPGAQALDAGKGEGKKGCSFGAAQPRMCWTCHFPTWWSSVRGCSRVVCPDHTAEARRLRLAMGGKDDADEVSLPSPFYAGDGGGPPLGAQTGSDVRPGRDPSARRDLPRTCWTCHLPTWWASVRGCSRLVCPDHSAEARQLHLAMGGNDDADRVPLPSLIDAGGGGPPPGAGDSRPGREPSARRDQPGMCWTCHFPTWWPSVRGCSNLVCPDHSAQARQLHLAMMKGCDADGSPFSSLLGAGDGPPPRAQAGGDVRPGREPLARRDQPRMCWTCRFPTWWPSVRGCSRLVCSDHSAEARQLRLAMVGFDADGVPFASLLDAGDGSGGPPPGVQAGGDVRPGRETVARRNLEGEGEGACLPGQVLREKDEEEHEHAQMETLHHRAIATAREHLATEEAGGTKKSLGPEGFQRTTVGKAVSASYDGTAKLWCLKTGALVRTFAGHKDAVMSAVFSPDGRRLLTAGYDGVAHVWCVASGARERTFRGSAEGGRGVGGLYSAVFSGDGRKVLPASADGVAVGRPAYGVGGLYGGGGLYSAVFSCDGRKVLTASADGVARVWDVATGACEWALRGHEDAYMRSAVFSPCGALILTASSDCTARLWRMEPQRLEQMFKGHGGWVNTAVFSPDGTLALTASADFTARLWRLRTGKSIGVFRGHTHFVRRAVFSPSGDLVLTCSSDWTAKLWTVGLCLCLRTFHGHEYWVNSAVLEPPAPAAGGAAGGGALVLTASRDHTMRLWRVDTGSCELTIGRPWGIWGAGGVHTDFVTSAEFQPMAPSSSAPSVPEASNDQADLDPDASPRPKRRRLKRPALTASVARRLLGGRRAAARAVSAAAAGAGAASGAGAAGSRTTTSASTAASSGGRAAAAARRAAPAAPGAAAAAPGAKRAKRAKRPGGGGDGA